MLVYVINHNGKPLMPCKPSKARKLLKAGKAKVLRTEPFTIKLKYGSTGYTQPITGGLDTGSKTVGCAAIGNGKTLYQSEVILRNDITRKMKQRAMYRRTRRGRLRYRKPRFLNRKNSTKLNRLPPSIKSKVNGHLREMKYVESILPISKWNIETASFDIHKITNPDISGRDYQKGPMKDFYNVKAFVLARDNYKCQSGRKCCSKKLHVHHIVFRSQGGTNTPSNLITLCEWCHEDLHADIEIGLKSVRRSRTKHATEVGIVKSQLEKALSGYKIPIEYTFGYLTKFKREQCLKLPKKHCYDAVAIACGEGEWVKPTPLVLLKRCVAKGDYQQTKGKRSEIKIPTGKLFGLRKFDYVQTLKGKGFVIGKRSSGYFSIGLVTSEILNANVNIKKWVKRLRSRRSVIYQYLILT